jgi:PAS domain S-box-containing protein
MGTLITQTMTTPNGAEVALRTERDFISAIFETISALVVVLDREGRIVQFNRACQETTGYSLGEVKGKSIWNLPLLVPEEIDAIKGAFSRPVAGQFPNRSENPWITKDGRRRLIAWSNTAIVDADGRVENVIGTGIDITEQKEAERALSESEMRFRELAENINEVFWLEDLNNAKVLYVGPGYERIWGRSRESLYSSNRSWMEGIHPEDKERVLAMIARQPPQLSSDRTYRIVRTDGRIRWIRARAFPVRDTTGRIGRRAAIVEDITEGKRAEDALREANRQLRVVSRRRDQVQEEERRHLSRELHDQIGQALTAAKIDLQSAQQSEDRNILRGHLNDTISILDQILQQVREISLDLRPPLLDDLGLAPALRWALDRCAQRAGLSAEFYADPNLQHADSEIETACFRVALEALTNITRHAKAQKVIMELRRSENALHLIVRDDGIGFDIADAAKRARRDRLGVLGMGERATVLGGRFKCISAPGRGTEVHGSFPFSLETNSTESE